MLTISTREPSKCIMNCLVSLGEKGVFHLLYGAIGTMSCQQYPGIINERLNMPSSCDKPEIQNMGETMLISAILIETHLIIKAHSTWQDRLGTGVSALSSILLIYPNNSFGAPPPALIHASSFRLNLGILLNHYLKLNLVCCGSDVST